MDFGKFADHYLERLKAAIDDLDRREIDTFVKLILDAYKADSTIFIMGNGGSASTASHFACDINKGACYRFEKRFSVMSLTDNLSTITAYSNDISYDSIFMEQLKNFLKNGDIVIAISGSGNSANVIKAVEYANSKGNITIGLTGYNGGNLRKIARHSVNANINDMQISEDLHLIITHVLMQILSKVLSDNAKRTGTSSDE